MGAVVGCGGLSEPNIGSDLGDLEMAGVTVDGGRLLSYAATRISAEGKDFYVPSSFGW
jgi:hypothetical protein